MVTANAMIGDREKYIAAGASDYISKLIKVAALRDALARVRKAAAKPASPKIEKPALRLAADGGDAGDEPQTCGAFVASSACHAWMRR